MATVIIKDMSRLGRDYLKIDHYREIFFIERDVRYIAINDVVDSAKSDNDFTPFRNLLNDFHSKDTSKKVRAIKRALAWQRNLRQSRPSCINNSCDFACLSSYPIDGM